MANTILETQGVTKTKRMDNAPEKRVELHMHTPDESNGCCNFSRRSIKRGS